MLNPGVTVIIDGKRYEVVRAVCGCDPCSACSFAHLEKCVFPCSQCNTSIEERLIPIRCYLRFCEKSYKPGQLVTINKHVYRIRKAPKGTTACNACIATNGRTACLMNGHVSGSCVKHAGYNYYLQLIK